MFISESCISVVMSRNGWKIALVCHTFDSTAVLRSIIGEQTEEPFTITVSISNLHHSTQSISRRT